ncbi:lysylphosphatidylglycerol synthase transmembrane domain-containing protein [Methanothrix sp.]|uniref:lysylphosphatidylglycerol synthase transmembrane domain-containing protein n=1 Tax=Methanothrix sp. TaxID=90426 RepID=UPI00257DE8A6|nr:lysylphosphatidylglycerol synthase transmembrane domain-containing protein [Methanothrix sp.]NPU87026.1 flippase-like domain-containing protein [Methanothrix sp.]
MRHKKILRLAFGLLLIAFLLHRLGPASVVHTILSARPAYVLVAISVYAVTFLILSTRWRMILHDMGGNVSLISAYQAFAGGMILSDITPARIGELSRPLLVRDKVELNRGLVSVLIDRISDILTILILGACGLILFLTGREDVIVILMMMLMALISAAIWRGRRAISDKLSGSDRLAPIARSFDDLSAIKDIRLVMIRSVLLTVIAWVTHALRVYILASSIDQTPSLQMLFFLLPLVSALSLIPVSISGLGLVEGGLAALLASQGVPASTGLSIAFLDRIVTVAFHIIAGGRAASRVL